MIHPIAAKTCTEAWLRAANLLAGTADKIAYNVILDVEQPITVTAVDQRIVEAVDRFLKKNESDPVATVAATIFPASDYRRNGVKGVFEDFPEKTYPKLTKTWGTYAGRLLRRGGKDGTTFNPLELTIKKLRAQKKRTGPLRSIYEANLVSATDEAGIALEDAARQNVAKIRSRWPRPEERIPPALFDEDDDPEERLPRRIEMNIKERGVDGKRYVRMQCNGVNIGGRLTDNKTEQDDYRFHDVFHLACAAILGWSPVTRALFKVKRKSKPSVDENQDGARAQLVEEGIATWIFAHARELDYFKSIGNLDYSLLKAIEPQVKGYEVERCPLWLWENAILEGYRVFRCLREQRSGIVIADLEKRSIEFKPLV